MSSLHTIGYVQKAHGIRGALRVRTSIDLSRVPHLYLNEKKYEIVRAYAERDDFLVELKGLADRTAAELLRGNKVAIEKELIPPAGEGELYVADLIGCRVFDVAGAELGEIISSYDSGAQEIIEVKGATTFLMPFVDGIIVEVDLAKRRIVCDPPEGLIEMNEAK